MRNAPLVGGALREATVGENVPLSVPHTPVTTAEPHPCALCPLCRCHAECRGWSW
jgi:hypothetical protein